MFARRIMQYFHSSLVYHTWCSFRRFCIIPALSLFVNIFSPAKEDIGGFRHPWGGTSEDNQFEKQVCQQVYQPKARFTMCCIGPSSHAVLPRREDRLHFYLRATARRGNAPYCGPSSRDCVTNTANWRKLNEACC